MASAGKVIELSVRCKNEVGALACVLGVLKKARVNVLGYNAATAKTMGDIQIVPKDAIKAGRALAKAGYSYKRKPVVYAKFTDKIGAGAILAQALAEARVNIIYSYATSGAGPLFGLVLKTNKDNVAIKTIRKL